MRRVLTSIFGDHRPGGGSWGVNPRVFAPPEVARRQASLVRCPCRRRGMRAELTRRGLVGDAWWGAVVGDGLLALGRAD